MSTGMGAGMGTGRTEHAEMLELSELAGLGSLEPEDQGRLEAHLARGCPECEEAMRSATAVADQLAAAIQPMDVGADVRERLMARVHADARAPVRPVRRPTWQGWALAASLLAALVLGGRLWQTAQQLEEARSARALAEADYVAERDEVRRVLGQLEEKERDRARIEQELASLRGTVDALTASTTRTVPLAGQGPTPDASARAYVDPESRRLILYVYDLAAAPPGKSYQLWVIADGEPVSAGVLAPASDGETRYDTVADATLEGGVTIAVTLEPEGGLEKPSGPIVLAGN